MRKYLVSIVCFILSGCLLLTACGGETSSTPDGSEPVLPDGTTDQASVTTNSTNDMQGSDPTGDTNGTDVSGNTTSDAGVSGNSTSGNVTGTQGTGAPTTSATGTQGTGAPTTVGTSPVKPTGGNSSGGNSSTTQKTQVTTTTTTKVSGGDGKLNVKDGVLYQPKTGKYNNYIKYRNTLANTYSKLTKDKKLKVVYFGGSVTVGYGATNQDTKSWRALIGKWLQDSFPNAEVTNLNRGTGESGTYLGSYRFQRDVVEANPDLVFIEYSINDLYANATYGQAASQYEAIVRGIRQKLPECDIVTILVTDQGRANGQLHEQAKAHEDVSIAYGIPTVHVGRALAMHLIDNAFTDQWSNYMIDIVHPNDKGYNFYYEVIREFMNACLKDYKHDGKVKKYTVPAQQCSVLHDGNVTAIMPSQDLITRSEALGGTGFRFVNDSYGLANYPTQLKSDVKNAKLVLEFTGTELVMLNTTSALTEFYITVDGGKRVKKKFVGTHDLSLNPTIMVTDLPSGKHTVIIEPINTLGPRSVLKIGAFFSRDAAKASRK